MPYKIIAHIDLSAGQPGMLIPIFSSTVTNLPYVQEMGEYLDIVEFVPFFDFELYTLVNQEEEKIGEVGDLGYVAFRTFDGSVVCEKIAEVLSYIEENIHEIVKFPRLHFQIQRIQGVDVTEAYPVWKTVSAELFDDETVQRGWVDSEHHLYQLQRRIWDDISTVNPEERPKEFGGSLSDYSEEVLFDWLRKRRNFLSGEWPRIWHNVVERLAFDDRLIALGEDWIYSIYAETQDLVSLKSVLFVVLNYYRSDERSKIALGQFLSDAFNPHHYLIYEFLRPISLFESILLTLSPDKDVDSSLDLLEFCARDLKDNCDFREIIFIALSRIEQRVTDIKLLGRIVNIVRNLQG